MEGIDIKIDYIGIDSTLMDTVSKESIKFKKRKKFIDTKNYIKKK